MKAALLLLLLALCVRGQSDNNSLMLLPLPLNYSLGETSLEISSSLKLDHSGGEIVSKAFDRFKSTAFRDHHPTQQEGGIDKISIEVHDKSANLSLYVSEAYTLDVTSEGIHISAETEYGALHGLTTLLHHIVFDFDSKSYKIANTPIHIEDKPRFPHRGILIDTSRHFLPLATIRQVIDSITYVKLNVLHWHIVDTQSFPVEVEALPKLWAGSWTPQERYTTQDVREIIAYATERGVRVIPEFDMPGHAGSWCVGHPEICPSMECREPLDPSNNATWDVVHSVLSEMSSTFPDEMMHLGGDEVDMTCWDQSSHIKQWLSERNMSLKDGYKYFVDRAHQMALDLGKDPVNWEEVFINFGSKLDKRTIIHIWLKHATLKEVVQAGYRALLSNSDKWYLDLLTSTWKDFYLNEPLTDIDVPAQQELVLGGEACMWGETVDTSDIMETIWPRTGAFAERMWSPRTVTSTEAFLPRLEELRCFLNLNGIASAPTTNAAARSSPPNPGSCYRQ